MANRVHAVFDIASGVQRSIPFTAEEERRRDLEEAAGLLEIQERVEVQRQRDVASKSVVQKLKGLGFSDFEIEALRQMV